MNNNSLKYKRRCDACGKKDDFYGGPNELGKNKRWDCFLNQHALNHQPNSFQTQRLMCLCKLQPDNWLINALVRSHMLTVIPQVTVSILFCSLLTKCVQELVLWESHHPYVHETVSLYAVKTMSGTSCVSPFLPRVLWHQTYNPQAKTGPPEGPVWPVGRKLHRRYYLLYYNKRRCCS